MFVLDCVITFSAVIVFVLDCVITFSAVIVFVVQEVERNRMDQKWIEKRLFEINRNISVIYISLGYAVKHGTLREDKTFWM